MTALRQIRSSDDVVGFVTSKRAGSDSAGDGLADERSEMSDRGYANDMMETHPGRDAVDEMLVHDREQMLFLRAGVHELRGRMSCRGRRGVAATTPSA